MLRRPLFVEIIKLSLLAWPILLAQVAQTSMGFVDAVMSGQAGTVDLAAVALGSAFWMPVILFGQGMLMAVIPAVARLRGMDGDAAVRDRALGHEMRQGIWLALLLSLPLMGVIFALTLAMPHFGYEAALTDMCCRYLRACMWGLPGYMLFVAMRCGLDGLSRVRVAMVTAFLGLGMNVVGNTIFVFGKLGVPAYGGVGSGIATGMVCWFMALMMLVQATFMPDVRSWLHPSRWEGPCWATLQRLVGIGLPGALGLLCEVTMFAAIAMLLAPLGPMVLAANQVTGSVSGMVFMIPLSIGMACTIRVGLHIGDHSADGARTAARAGMSMGVFFATITATAMLLLNRQIPSMYTDDPIVSITASGLLLLAATYQFPDSIQVVAVGALRAYNDTRAILVISFLTYWCLGLPLGYILGRTHLIVPAMGARGFWLAIVIGLTVASVLMLARLLQQERLLQRQSGRNSCP